MNIMKASGRSRILSEAGAMQWKGDAAGVTRNPDAQRS